MARLGVAALLAGAFLFDGFAPGRAGRAAVDFFFELRARVVAVFFFDFFLDVAFEADFFLVTFAFASFRLTDDFPALVDFFLLAFFLAFFWLDFFLAGFFLLVFFLLTPCLAARFLLEPAFFLDADFLLLDFLGARATERLRELFFADFLAIRFLAETFFFGMRSTPGRLQMQPAIIQI